jgi:hypothetical protein
MVNICRNSSVYSFVAVLLLLSFGLREPAQAYGLSDAAFSVRVSVLISKANKYKKSRDEKGLIKVMFDIKSEVEGYTGHKISLTKMIDQVAKDAARAGRPIPPKYIEAYKRKFKAVEKSRKKSSKGSGWLFSVGNHHQFDNSAYLYGKSNRKDPREKEKEVNVPVRMSFGITMMLVAGFLSRIPIPMCQKAAAALAAYGAQEIYQSWVGEEEKKENQEVLKRESS